MAETKNICYSQFSLVKKMMVEGVYEYDEKGRDIGCKFNTIKLTKILSFLEVFASVF
jgi:hypothetical protein